MADDQNTINTYTISYGKATLKEVLILPSSRFQIGASLFPIAKERKAGRETYYEMRDLSNVTILITDENGFATLTGGGRFGEVITHG